LFLFDATVTTT